MSCKHAVEAMTDAEEGALTGWRKLNYRFHMKHCPACNAHRRQLAATTDAMKLLGCEKPSDDARDRALAAFRKNKKAL